MSEPPKKKQRKDAEQQDALPDGAQAEATHLAPPAHLPSQFSAQLAYSPQLFNLPFAMPSMLSQPAPPAFMPRGGLTINTGNEKSQTSLNPPPGISYSPYQQPIPGQMSLAQDPLTKALQSLVPLQNFSHLHAMAQMQAQALAQAPGRQNHLMGPQGSISAARADLPGNSLSQMFPHVALQPAPTTSQTWVGESERPDQECPPTKTGPFSTRERFFEEMEKNGTFQFHYIQNDGHRQHLIWLVALRNIYSKQLPNMPRDYITRLVFDRRHRSVAVVKQDGSVIGGITYRPFPSQAFGEIAFCAVTSTDQVKGFGSRLMSHTKEFAKSKDNLTFFLTYADNNAVTFFAKQGFTTEVTRPRNQWHGYIKDYDGGTLMESILEDELCYTSLAHMIQAQQAALVEKMSGLCTAFVVHQGLNHFRQPNVEPLQLEQIPGLQEAGWTPEKDSKPPYLLSVDGRLQEPSREVVSHLGKSMIADLQAHDDAVAFLQPVKADEVPDYAEIIKNPVDFSKIERTLATNTFYINLEILEADIRRIFKNAKVYNASDTYWYKAATRLEQYFDRYLASHVCVA